MAYFLESDGLKEQNINNVQSAAMTDIPQALSSVQTIEKATNSIHPQQESKSKQKVETHTIEFTAVEEQQGTNKTVQKILQEHVANIE